VECGAVVPNVEAWLREPCHARTAPPPVPDLEPNARGIVTLTCDRGPIYGHRGAAL
jgi:hypothetical protein